MRLPIRRGHIAMRWLRHRWGSYLALAALLFQLALTFGHVHLGHVHLGHVQFGHVDLAHAGSSAGEATIAAVGGHGDEAPSSPDAPDHDHCATCALIHLAQALLTPDAPILPHPVSLDPPRLIAVAAGLTPPLPALFRARAPPHA